MDYPLAPHLRHSGSGAWFHPFTLCAAFSTSIGEAISEEEKLAYIHEYIHYLQDNPQKYNMKISNSLVKMIYNEVYSFKYSGNHRLSKQRKKEYFSAIK